MQLEARCSNVGHRYQSTPSGDTRPRS
jgi:hypothetical protein